MKKLLIIFSAISGILLLASCNAKEKETNSKEFNAPEYNVSEYDISQYISEINHIYSEENGVVLSGIYKEDYCQIIERKSDSNEILNHIPLQSDMGIECNGFYLKNAYYIDGIKFTSDGKNVSPGDLYKYRVLKTINCTPEKTTFLIKDENKSYRIVEVDISDNIVKNGQINISAGVFVEDIVWYDGYYYIGTSETEAAGNEKSIRSSILKLNDKLDVIDETEDIDIEKIDGIIPQTDGTWIVYCFDENKNETRICIADGDLSTFSDVKIFSGIRQIFDAAENACIFISDFSSIYKYNIITDKSECICSAPDISEPDKCIFLSCDGTSYSYYASENIADGKKIHVSSDCDIHTAADKTDSFNFEFDDNNGIIAISKLTGKRITFPDVDEQDDIYYHIESGNFLVKDKNQKIKIYNGDGSFSGVIDSNEFEVDRIILYGINLSVILKKNDEYYYAEINFRDNCYTNIKPLGSSELLKDAGAIYRGNSDILFYVFVDGYIFGYLPENKEFELIIDFSSLYTDTPLLYINRITSEKYQLVTQDKIYCITRTSPSDIIPEITIGNLTCSSLNPYLDIYPENFNNYKINIVDYFSEDGDMSVLNRDVLSGNIPDIIISSTETEISYLENIGVLEQLDRNKIYDENTEYLENIVNLFETDGALYKFPCGFSLSTLINYGEYNENWNYDTMISYLNRKENKEYFGSYINLFRLFMPMYNKDFADESDMFSESGKKILREYAEELYSWTIKNDIYDYSNEEFLEYKSITLDLGLKQYIQRDGWIICGYPSFDKPITYVYSPMLISVSSGSSEKEICYDFIKRAIKKGAGSSFSIEMNEFNEMINSISLEFDASISGKIKELVMNSHEIAYCNKFVDSIVDEELMRYYDGLADIDTAIESMEKRIQIYRNEQN